MTTARKVILIIATVLLLGGAALSLGAFAAAGFDIRNLSNTPRDYASNTTTLEAEAASPHTNIVVRDESESVRFEQTDGDAIEVTYWTNKDKSMDVSDEAGVVAIEGSASFSSHIMFMRIDFEDHATVVKVPRSYTGSITLEGDSLSASAEDLKGLNSVSLRVNSGSLKVTGIDARSINLQTSSGSIDVSDVAATEDFAAATSSGSIAATNIDAATIETTVSSGIQELRFLHAQTINARSSSGSIHAIPLAADTIALEASSGSIDAVIAGDEDDYLIDATSTSGSALAPRGALQSEKRVSARATSGSVSLVFDEAVSAPETPAAPAA